jgi:Putative zinc-finger
MTDPKLDERHESVWLLLPWHANGTLEAAERRLVEDHLAGCPSCREEMARCNAFAAALRDREEIAPSPHPLQLARLMERIEASERGFDAPSENGESGENGDSGEHGENDARGEDRAVETAAASSRAGELAGETSAPVRDGTAAVAAAARAGRAGALPGVAAMPSGRADGGSDRKGGIGAIGDHRRGGERRASLLGDTPRPVRWALAGQLAALVLLSATLAVGPARRFESGKLAAPASERAAAPAGAVYHTLSAPSALAASAVASAAGAAAPQIRVMFAEAATEKQMREVLLSTRGRLVDGPSPLGTYTLELPAPASAAAAPPAGGSRGTGAGDAAPASAAPRASHAEAAPDSMGIVLAYLRSQPIVRFAEPVAGTGTPATSSPAPAAPGLGTAPEAPQGTPEAPPP